MQNGSQLIITNIGENKSFNKHNSLERQIPFFDISVDLTILGNTNAPIDWHPNAAAHRAYANNLLRVLNLPSSLAAKK